MKRHISMLFPVLISLSVFHVSAWAQTPAARVGDPTNHTGVIISGSPTVLIEGRPAARIGDTVSCPLFEFFIPEEINIPHVGGLIVTGSSTVLIGGIPAARVGSIVPEQLGKASVINGGAPTVIIGG